MPFDHKQIEKKWQKYWDDNKTFYTDVWDFSKPKYYALDMFPYPSGQGLHVGHPEGYTATDIMSRMKRMQGYNVLHPMGFDSFGLPAEQYAIKTGNHPEGFTLENIATFTKQLKMLGFSFDWEKCVSTCDPDYYKWTQWAFIQMFNHWFNKDTQKAVEVSIDTVKENTMYSPKAFKQGTTARSYLQSMMSDKATEDRQVVETNLKNGQDLTQATASFTSDEYFEKWYQETKTQLQTYED